VAIDLERDGDLDLVVHNVFRPLLNAYRNEVGKGRSVAVALRGTKSNRFGVGARLVATYGGKRQAQDMTCGTGYLTSQPLELHWGLGEAERIEKLEIRWPGGTQQTIENISPGRVTIDEHKGAVDHHPHSKAAQKPLVDRERIAREGETLSIELKYPDASAFDLGALKGRPLVLHFWSLYCKSCEREVGAYDTYATEIKRVAPKAQIVSINVDDDAKALVKRLANKPIAINPVMVARGATGWLPSVDPLVPLTVVVDAEGIVRMRHVGAIDPAKMASLVERALKPKK
jgi:thiol-disulfide isomerase/thioredoxin